LGAPGFTTTGFVPEVFAASWITGSIRYLAGSKLNVRLGFRAGVVDSDPLDSFEENKAVFNGLVPNGFLTLWRLAMGTKADVETTNERTVKEGNLM
jgi:hypothetical protein